MARPPAAAEFLLATCGRPTAGFALLRAGVAKHNAYLDDCAGLASALVAFLMRGKVPARESARPSPLSLTRPPRWPIS